MNSENPSNQKQTPHKKVLDSLKEKLEPLTEAEGDSLTGGFASGTADPDGIDPTLNVSCPTNSHCTVNSGPNCK